MHMTTLPAIASGQQYDIGVRNDRASVVEVGAGLRSYVAHGRELLDGHAADEMATSGRGQVLVPWPNRLRDGRYRWDGEEHQVPINEPAKGNAIHGLVRFLSWTCLLHTSTRVDLGCLLRPRPGYPFTLEVTMSYRISATGLTVVTTARNAGAEALPYAFGQHPYLSLGGGLIDDGTLEAPGATYLPTDDRGIPTGVSSVDGTAYDFRTARPLGSAEIDYAFTDLSRDSSGKAWVRLHHPDGAGTAVWVDESCPYVELFTGDTLPADRRRRGLGVEPMTAPPNAFGSGKEIHRIEPDDSVTTSWGIQALD
jgi:aldose 1-epimerase